MNVPGPLGPKAAAIAVVIALLNAVTAVPSIEIAPAPVVILGCLFMSYAWVLVLQTVVRIVFTDGAAYAR